VLLKKSSMLVDAVVVDAGERGGQRELGERGALIKGPTADAGERGGEGHVPLPDALATNESESADVRCVGNGGKVDVGEGGATEERAEAKVVRDVGNVREVRAEHP